MGDKSNAGVDRVRITDLWEKTVHQAAEAERERCAELLWSVLGKRSVGPANRVALEKCHDAMLAPQPEPEPSAPPEEPEETVCVLCGEKENVRERTLLRFVPVGNAKTNEVNLCDWCFGVWNRGREGGYTTQPPDPPLPEEPMTIEKVTEKLRQYGCILPRLSRSAYLWCDFEADLTALVHQATQAQARRDAAMAERCGAHNAVKAILKSAGWNEHTRTE